MKNYCLIFLAVSNLAHKDGLSYGDIYKSIKSDLDSDIQSRIGDLPIIFGNAASCNGTLGLPRNENEGYRGKYRNYFDIDSGNPDIHGKIQRPCQVYDTFCIRKFFAEHSRCKISGWRVPEPVYRAQLTVNYPHTNMSATQLNVEYTGLSNARIEEFYINTVTDNLVIALHFPSANLFGNETTLKFYLRGREPIVLRDFGGVNPLSFSVTVIIPHLENLKLGEAEITTYFDNPVLPFVVGPDLAKSTDPEVEAMLAAFLATDPLDQMEAGFTDPNFYAATFIQ